MLYEPAFVWEWIGVRGSWERGAPRTLGGLGVARVVEGNLLFYTTVRRGGESGPRRE